MLSSGLQLVGSGAKSLLGFIDPSLPGVAGDFLTGMAGYINPNLLTAFQAQNNATGGNGSVNNTGKEAAEVANAENGLEGKTASPTVENKTTPPAASGMSWQQVGAALAPNILSGLKTGLDKSYDFKPLWGSSSVRLPTYVLGR